MRHRLQDSSARHTIETDQLQVTIASSGYVSGIASLIDRRTGARDLGFGLDIVDFLLEPADPTEPVPEGQYPYGPTDMLHGNIPKRYVEGPQICTQARRLPVEVARGPDFTVVRQSYRWKQAYAPRERAGSVWEQTIVIPDRERFVLASDRVKAANESRALVLRIDMPGHLRHSAGNEFEHVYLSYQQPTILPSTEFANDFPPDARFLYRRPAEEAQIPRRFIRAYQVNLAGGDPGPWLAGMTLHAGDVAEAWCHQRGYVCMIEEIGGRPTRPGDSFGACYVIGWFDEIDEMEATYDRYRGASALAIDGPRDRPTGYRTVSNAS